MFKLAFFAVLGIAIWGGVFKSLSFSNTEGDVGVNINKSEAIKSVANGWDKATTAYNNVVNK